MNNLNELKLMEAQINQIFQIIENAENREISKIAAETLANKCLDNPFAIYIIFKNFLDFSTKGKLRVFDEAGFLIDLILEEMDKDTIKKLFETDYLKECIKNIYEDNKIFYSFDNLNYQFESLENIKILNFEILKKINIENIEALYSNKAEDWNNLTSDIENKMAFGKMDLEILFPIKDDIKQEIEQCLNVNKCNNQPDKENENRIVTNVGKEKITINEFFELFKKDITLKNLSHEKSSNLEMMNNIANLDNKIHNGKDYLLNKKINRDLNIIENEDEEEISCEIENIENSNVKLNKKTKSKINNVSLNNNNISNTKKRKIEQDVEQKKEKLEFYFNPLYFVVDNFIKLNSNENWKSRLCSISSLTLLNKFFKLFYFKFFKITCNLITNVTKKQSDKLTYRRGKGNKKNSKESESQDDHLIDVTIEDLKISQMKNFENNSNYKNESTEEDEFFKFPNIIYEDLNNIFSDFERLLKENLFTNLFINSLIDKVVDFDSEDYICIFKDLNLKLANRILDSIESKIDNKQVNQEILELNRSIYQILNQAIATNKNNSDWQPIFSILTFLKIKINGNNLQEKKKDDDFSIDINPNCGFLLEKPNIIYNNNYNEILFGKNSFFNFSFSNKEYSIFSLIENLMKIDSEEIVNISIQILDKLMEKFNSENYNSDHINISKDKNRIISIYKNFILLINKYDDIEVGVKYYFNCLHNFIIFFKNLNEKNSSLEDDVSKDIIENDLIFYALNKNKSVRIKYFNLINNILEGKLIYFTNHRDFIQKNVLLAIQGICVERDEEVLNTQKNFVINIINSNEEACLDVFFNFSKFILKLILKFNIKDSKNFFVPNNQKFLLNEMEAFYSAFFVNDMQIDIIKTNHERKMKYMIPIIANVLKNRIEYVRIIIKNLNLDFGDLKMSKYLLFFLKIYYNYLELIDDMANKTLMIPEDILNILMDNKKLDDLPIKIKKKDVDSGIGIALKFFVDFLEKYINNNKENFNNAKITNEVDNQNFLIEEYNKVVFIYNNLVNFRILKIAEFDDLLKIIFNKIKEYENFNSSASKNGKIDLIYENFKIITNNLKKTDEDYLSLKIKIRAYSSICLFYHSKFSNFKIDKISIFVNPILNCLKINSKEAKIFCKNLINMTLNYTTNLDSRNKITNLFIDYCLNSYSDEVNNIPNFHNLLNNCPSQSSDNTKDGGFNLNHPKDLKINYPIKYFFNILAKLGQNLEMKKIFENFNNNLPSSDSCTDDNTYEESTTENSRKSKLENFYKKNIYFFYNVCLIKRDLNFIRFDNLKSLLKNIIFEEFLLNMSNIEKYVSFIIVNFSKLIDIEDTDFDNSLIIDLIFNYLNTSSTPNGNDLKNDEKNSHDNKLINPRSIEFIFKILNIISDSQNFQLICINYIFDVIKFINSKNEKLRTLATSLFSKLMKIISYLKLDKSYESQLIKMKKSLKGFDNFNSIKNFVQQKDIKESNIENHREDFSLCIKIKENLRYYQIAGIKWLSTLTSLGLGLALCDDMGLGKTIQTLCCIANETTIFQKRYNKSPISLIICPNTLILNWIKESRKFFDESEFKLKKFEGKSFKNLSINNIQNKKNKSNNNQINDLVPLAPIEIYVTSYDKIREMEEIDQEFFYVILDEAHIIKNPKTKLYQNIKKLNSERRIILTGTPIQNNVMELWSLFDFLMPGFLGTENDFEIKFHKKIYTNIKKLNLEEKLQENIFQSSLNDIRKRIKPFILRRLKQDVLKELPDKIIQDYICEMTQVQKDLYNYWDNIYSTVGIKDDKKANNKKTTSVKKIGSNKNHQPILKIIDSMRKICNYPGMLLNKDNIDKEGNKYIEKYKDKINDFNCSGKLKALEDILISFNFLSINSEIYNNCNGNSNVIANNVNSASNNNNKLSENKILIFSQYKGMLNIIKNFIELNFKSINVKILSSEMNEILRSEIVNNFNSDPDINILLLTTSIGGLGLSLTAANIVIMYDHDWNPMRDLQAMDRAHRLGQKKTVEVFRLITAESIEEKLISLQTFKKYIANNVVDQTKIHETNLNMENFMESLEEFSNNKTNNLSYEKEEKKKNRRNIIDSMHENDDKIRFNEEIEFEYLKKFI